MPSWPDEVRKQRAQGLNLPSNSSWSKIHELEKKLRSKENMENNGLSKAKDPRALLRKAARKARKKQMADLCGRKPNEKWEKLRYADREMFKKELANLAEGLKLSRNATEKEVDNKLRLDGSLLTAKDIICGRRSPNE